MVTFNLDILSPNLVLLLDQIIQNNNLVKYLYYNVENPLAQPNLADNSVILFNKLWPQPFDEQIATEDFSNLRVYFANIKFENNAIVSDSIVTFDIIVAKSLWLINTGTPVIRPYEIAKEVVATFRNNSVGTVGRLMFLNFQHMGVNQKFDAIRLTAKMTTFSAGQVNG